MATQREMVGEGLAVLGGTIAVIGAIVTIAVVVVMVAALISILVDANVTKGGKLLWILGVLWLPLFGAVAWFVVGRKGELNRLLGIDRGRGRPEVYAQGGRPAGPGQGGVVPPSPA